jgi:type I restriction enzyme S subunit
VRQRVANDAELPEGWVETQLANVFDLNPPKPAANEVAADTLVTFVPMPAVDADARAITNPQSRAFAEVRKGFTSFRDNDVILAKITPCFENGKAAACRGLLNGLGFGSTEFHVLRSTGAMLPEYVYHFTRQDSFLRDGAANMTGSVGQKRVPAAWLGSVTVPLPPIAEQRRIVAKVEELLGRVGAARERSARLPVLLKRFRQSLLAAACSGQLTADWRTEHSAHAIGENSTGLLVRVRSERRRVWKATHHGKAQYEEPRSSGGDGPFDVPTTWMWVRWEQIGFAQNGTAFPSKHYTEKGVKLLRPGNLHVSGRVEWNDDNTRYMPEGWLEQKPDFVIRGQELVMNLTAQSLKDEFLGRVCMTDDREFCLLNQRIARITPIVIDPRYCFWVFKSPVFRRYVDDLNTGSLIQHMFTSQVSDFLFPLSPIAEQREIVRRVDSLFALADKIEARVQAATARVEKIAQAILAKAFRGELVRTEAELARQEGRDYEPASVLLERIRREREAQTDRKPRSKRSTRKGPRRKG